MNCNDILLFCSKYKRKNKYASEPQSLVLTMKVEKTGQHWVLNKFIFFNWIIGVNFFC